MGRTRKWGFRSTVEKLAEAWHGITRMLDSDQATFPSWIGNENEMPGTDPVWWLESVEHPVLVAPETEIPETGMVCTLTPELSSIPPA